jgi:hypothetical protein
MEVATMGYEEEVLRTLHLEDLQRELEQKARQREPLVDTLLRHRLDHDGIVSSCIVDGKPMEIYSDWFMQDLMKFVQEEYPHLEKELRLLQV